MFELLVQEKPTKEIAQQLFISEKNRPKSYLQSDAHLLQNPFCTIREAKSMVSPPLMMK
ncbi:hypothetical protein HMPREF9374_0065 [Desmospora sp. 8437]|nr:hypothetical protein HMPREF9374_0065 [Desmospora sp. 8437]